MLCYAPSHEFDYLIMKFDLISVIFRLHGLSTVFRNFLKNVKTLEPQFYQSIQFISLFLASFFFTFDGL